MAGFYFNPFLSLTTGSLLSLCCTGTKIIINVKVNKAERNRSIIHKLRLLCTCFVYSMSIVYAHAHTHTAVFRCQISPINLVDGESALLFR